jgi:hypothetical protein
MARLENPKHEEYALLLAQGLTQKKAYVQAGYSDNPQAASKLAQAPKFKKRVKELKQEIAQQIQTAMAEPSVENWESLSEMGLTMEWVARQYQEVYKQSLDAGAFAPANTALQNIQKLIEMENDAKGAEDTSKDALIPVSAVTEMLTDMRGVFEAKANAEASIEVGEQLLEDMKDITPDAG